jgi:hypothetical protein
MVVREALGHVDVRAAHLRDSSPRVRVFDVPNLEAATKSIQLPHEILGDAEWLVQNPDVEGLSAQLASSDFAILLKTERFGRPVNEKRKLFTLGHEVGHVTREMVSEITGRPPGESSFLEARRRPDQPLGAQGRTTYESYWYRRAEDWCDCFAAELLIPRSKLDVDLRAMGFRDTWRHVRKVSLPALVRRVLTTAPIPLLGFIWEYGRSGILRNGWAYVPENRGIPAPLQELLGYSMASGLVAAAGSAPVVKLRGAEPCGLRSAIHAAIRDGLPRSARVVTSQRADVTFVAITDGPARARADVVGFAYMPAGEEVPAWLRRIPT